MVRSLSKVSLQNSKMLLIEHLLNNCSQNRFLVSVSKTAAAKIDFSRILKEAPLRKSSKNESSSLIIAYIRNVPKIKSFKKPIFESPFLSKKA